MATRTCDRCGKTAEGTESELAMACYFDVSPGAYWEPYGEDGEEWVCCECMADDPDWQRDYGSMMMTMSA